MSNIIARPDSGEHPWVVLPILLVVKCRNYWFNITSLDCCQCGKELGVTDFLDAEGFCRVNGDSKYGYEGVHLTCKGKQESRFQMLRRDALYQIRRFFKWVTPWRSSTHS